MNEPFGLEEMKEIEYSTLVYIDRLCRQHNITYWLAYGTLLGAVRHKGFIPWDDDIDIWMPAEDYHRFLKLVNDDEDSHYRAVSHQTDVRYPYFFAKVMDTDTLLREEAGEMDLGVYVDVFALIGLPKCPLLRTAVSMKCTHLLRSWTYATVKDDYRYSFIKTCLRKLYHMYALQKGTLYWNQKIRKFMKKHPVENAEYITDVNKTKCAWQAAEFEAVHMVFESEKFPVSKGFHAVLTAIYGDYMQLPPEEEQISHHYFTAYKRRRKQV